MHSHGPPLPPGALVAARYQILSPLGEGGMARVYVARDRELERCVALKVVPRAAEDEDRFRRFCREARNGARLAHPLCAGTFDAGRDRGAAYLAVELLEGPSLRDELGRRGRFPPHEAGRVVAQICEALDHAHGRGVLHRDLKPENVVFRRPGGDAVLIDFGLSLLRDDAPLTAVGSCVGSPTYLAPERLLERDYDGRADLYAAGVLLYELVAGAPPFRGTSPAAIARQHIESRPAPLASRAPGVPLALAAACDRALARDPAQRFASAGEMAAALRRALGAPAAVPAGAAVAVPPPAAPLAAAVPPPPEAGGGEPTVPFHLREPRPLRRLVGWLRYGRWRRPWILADR